MNFARHLSITPLTTCVFASQTDIFWPGSFFRLVPDSLSFFRSKDSDQTNSSWRDPWRERQLLVRKIHCSPEHWTDDNYLGGREAGYKNCSIQHCKTHGSDENANCEDLAEGRQNNKDYDAHAMLVVSASLAMFIGLAMAFFLCTTTAVALNQECCSRPEYA